MKIGKGFGMKYKIYKRTNKNYDYIFTKEKSTDEIHLKFGEYDVKFIEQQFGVRCNETMVHLSAPGKASYTMSLTTFFNYLTNWHIED